MNLKIYNFLTRKKEVFKPIKKGLVGFYACGPTVYDYAHIGNLRTYIFEDVLRRTLETGGFKVKEIMNITDIEDKIIAGAKKAGKNIRNFSEPYKKAFFEDLDKLNIKKAWKYPEAIKHIAEMVKLIQKLIKNKLAYESAGSIYFDVSKFKPYGRLSRIKKGELKIGARVDADEYKKNAGEDFVLWKRKKSGEPFWNSPFGSGRPGWHIECSAMSMKYLGAGFDIHAGGIDLLFPHHENEIAQSEGAAGTKKRFVRYFLEGEHLLVDGRKMAKSLGNIFTLSDLERRGFNPLAFRYLTLGAHYRSKLNFTWESLQAAQTALGRVYDFVRALRQRKNIGKSNFHPQVSAFKKSISDDLDTPKALAVVWQLIKDYNKFPQKYDPKEVLGALYDFDRILGLGLKDLKTQAPLRDMLKLFKEREKARKDGDFKKADKIREEIKRLGWQINDTPSGSYLNPVTSRD